MKRVSRIKSEKKKLVLSKLDPGIFVIEVPEAGRKISLGQPPDAVKRLQQVGYFGEDAVDTFVIVDSKLQGDSVCWALIEFPVLYALYLCTVEINGNSIPAFFAGKYPMLVGLENDVKKALKMLKYGNYGVDSLEEIDEMDIPEKTKTALKSEILGLAVGNEIKDSDTFIHSVILTPEPKNNSDFSDIGDGIRIGKIGYNRYQIIYGGDSIEVDVTLKEGENFRAPIAYKHFKFPITNFGIWHTGEYDGMDPYYSCAHTTVIHQYEPILIDYPSNITDIINHNGLSKTSIDTVLVTHNHDDHIGGMVELFRRNTPCNIITTEPVKHSLIKKLSTMVDLPESSVSNAFNWTILPFRKDNPYQTETLNLNGLHITGHLSCHSVPTTLYTLKINQNGKIFTYGHFVDITAFKRMEMLVKNNQMPVEHYEHLRNIIHKQKYSLLKYDVGCPSDAAVPFTVHGQWQDLKDAATEKSFRVFTHVNKSALDPEFEKEGRFVRIGDLDTAVRTEEGQLVSIQDEKSSITAFFYHAYQLVIKYFESLVDKAHDLETHQKIKYYAYIFANTSKQLEPNIGSFLIEQGKESDYVYIIVRGRAAIRRYLPDETLITDSRVGDGEVLGDIGVLSKQHRMASVKTLNRLTYLAIPSNLFEEAMHAINVNYEGDFKNMFERRLLFQSACEISQDVSTIILNQIARNSQLKKIKKGHLLLGKEEQKNQTDKLIIIGDGIARIKNKKSTITLSGPTVLGEYQFLEELGQQTMSTETYSITAETDMDVLYINYDILKNIPLVIDNLRWVIKCRAALYQQLEEA